MEVEELGAVRELEPRAFGAHDEPWPVFRRGFLERNHVPLLACGDFGVDGSRRRRHWQ
jgi:hypothetical protein